MPANSVTQQVPYFSDILGNALEGGFVYVGTAGLDAQANPIAIFSDAALTVPMANPVRTVAGYPAVFGAPTPIYAGGDCSLTILDASGAVVYKALSNNVLALGSAAGLDSIAGLTTAANQFLYTTAPDTFAVAPANDLGRTLLAQENTGPGRLAARAALELTLNDTADFENVAPANIATRAGIFAEIGRLIAAIPSSQNPVSLLQTTDLTGLAQADFESFDSAAFFGYEFVLSNVVVSATSVLLCRVSTDGGTTYSESSSAYDDALVIHVPESNANAVATENDAGSTGIKLSDMSSGARTHYGKAFLWDPDLAKSTVLNSEIYTDGAATKKTTQSLGEYEPDLAVDGIRFILSTGTFTSGTLRVYGHRR